MDVVTCNRTSFQPGWKGGPGRPRQDVAVPTANAVAKLARSFSQEALETLVKMMRNAELPVRIKACEAVLNRGISLPAVAIDELRAIEAHLAEHAIDLTPGADMASS
jgi:hypothetical protein